MKNINITISETESRRLLDKINKLLEQYQPPVGHMLTNYDAVLAEPLNSIYRELTGEDHPNYVKYHEQCSEMLLKQLKKLSGEAEDYINSRISVEYYNIMKQEIETVNGYLEAINESKHL